MISKNEYELLKRLKVKKITVNEALKLSHDEQMQLQSLTNKRYIVQNTFDDPYVISDLGSSAIEEYEQNLREEVRQIEANQIAKESLKKATRANRIALGSFIAAVISAAAAIAAAIAAFIIK